MSSNKNVENARRFLWDGDDSSARSRAAQTSRGFSTRDYVVDQSVNLMDIGEGGPSDNTSRSNHGTSGSSRISSALSGLFRATTGVEYDEYGDAAPSTDADEYIDSDKRRRVNPLRVACLRFGSKGCMTFAVALIGLTLVITTLTVTLTKGDNGGNDAGGSSNVTNNDDHSPRYVNIQTRIVQEGVTAKEVFGEMDISPQQSALKWLVHEDPAKLPYDHPALVDRYGLAVFYFSSSNAPKTSLKGGWKNNSNWMTKTGICEWHGIECIPREQEATAENDFYPFTQTYNDNAQITGIRLEGNSIEGYIPEEFSSLSELMILDMNDNKLSRALPTKLGKLQKLRDLLVKGNALVGTLPVEFGTLTKLHQLNFAKNRFEGPIPQSWNELKELRYFAVSQNMLTGTFPNLSKMTRMTGLFLEDNDFKGTLPDSLGTLTDMLDLRLGQNNFTGPLTMLTSLQNLETLYLNNNLFSGNIPDMFDQLFRLHELMMQKNQFVGSIPLTLTHLQSLKTLNLAHNKLDGSIPAGLGLLTDAVSISLNHNNFKGEIPSLLGKLDDITLLSLNHNSFSGAIPTELGACFRLVSVHIESNKLAGEIPTELGELTALRTLRLESNKMVGVNMPSQICSLFEEDLSVLAADCLENEQVSCTCCTECV